MLSLLTAEVRICRIHYRIVYELHFLDKQKMTDVHRTTNNNLLLLFFSNALYLLYSGHVYTTNACAHIHRTKRSTGKAHILQIRLSEPMWNVSFRFCHNFSEVLVFVYPAQLKIAQVLHRESYCICVHETLLRILYSIRG